MKRFFLSILCFAAGMVLANSQPPEEMAALAEEIRERTLRDLSPEAHVALVDEFLTRNVEKPAQFAVRSVHAPLPQNAATGTREMTGPIKALSEARQGATSPEDWIQRTDAILPSLSAALAKEKERSMRPQTRRSPASDIGVPEKGSVSEILDSLKGLSPEDRISAMDSKAAVLEFQLRRPNKPDQLPSNQRNSQ